MKIPGITAEDLKAKLSQGEKFTLLDVRQEAERKKSHIPGSQFIPLSHLAQRFEEIDPASEIVVYCHMGGRSAQAAGFLIQKGYRAINLLGGISAWTLQGYNAPPK